MPFPDDDLLPSDDLYPYEGAPMATIRRLFGFVADDTLGGTAYDGLVAGAIPDPDTFWPITNVTIDKGLQTIDRNEEVRGRRGNTAPISFRAAPSATVQGLLYPDVAKKLVRLATGGTDSITGTSPAAITHRFDPVGFGTAALPAVHLAVVRDDVYHKLAGCQVSELQFNFPVDGEATFEATFVGKYYAQEDAAAPTATYDLSPNEPFMLRDAQMFVDGDSEAIDGLRGFNLTFNNGFRDPDFYPMRNRVAATTATPRRIVWFPEQRRLGSAQTVSGQVQFHTGIADEDRKQDLTQAQEIVFDVESELLDTTPEVAELLRITCSQTVYTGGGLGALTRDDDIQSEYELGVYVDESIGRDIRFEFRTDNTALIT